MISNFMAYHPSVGTELIASRTMVSMLLVAFAHGKAPSLPMRQVDERMTVNSDEADENTEVLGVYQCMQI